MLDRKSLVFTLWLAGSLVLLAWVLVVPDRTSRLVTVPSRPDCARRNVAVSPDQPAIRLVAGVATDAGEEANALSSEDEEEDPAVALDEPRVCFPSLGSFRTVPNRRLAARRPILAFYPLRC